MRSSQQDGVWIRIDFYISQYTLQFFRLLYDGRLNAHQLLIINIHERGIFTYRFLSLEELKGQRVTTYKY